LPANRPVRVENKQAWVQNRSAYRTEINNYFRQYPTHLPAYGAGFWGRYPGWRWRWGAYGVNWWRVATWGAVAAWLPWRWSQPAYYNYGDNIYYQDGSVYYGDNAVATAEEYAQQAQQLAQAVPEDVDTEKVEWMPLGVFALTQDGEASGPEPTIFLQLAVSKQGIIAGTVQNKATDNAFEVEGTIDQKSQRAAWGPVGKSWPIMETGINNLTQDSAPALLHFEDGQTQQWLLVRLDEQKTDATSP
jgi:hypothetical protein